MKTFEISNDRLVEFFSRRPGKESTDRGISAALCRALSDWGAQAEYLTVLINDWTTARDAEERAIDPAERRIFRSAAENALRYVADLLRYGYRIDGMDELALYRTLNNVWKHFRGEQ